MDRGRSQLAAFQTSERPVRWWHVSAPVNIDTGEIAVRIPGQCSNTCSQVADYGPQIHVQGSNLQNKVEDDLKRAFIIVDVDKLANVSLAQLGDYIAMVALAQVNPYADTSRYSTILNVFENSRDTPEMTLWDRTYLKGLYEAEVTRANVGAARQEVVASILRTHRELVTEQNLAQ